jgi:hypothetical protein
MRAKEKRLKILILNENSFTGFKLFKLQKEKSYLLSPESVFSDQEAKV